MDRLILVLLLVYSWLHNKIYLRNSHILLFKIIIQDKLKKTFLIVNKSKSFELIQMGE
mgnify:CR=1 FL=1